MGGLVKERLTGAIILVALIVLLVPELLRGPVRSAPPALATASAEEPPLRSYTINLGDAHGAPGAQPESAAPQPVTAAEPAPAMPVPQSPPAQLPPAAGTPAPASPPAPAPAHAKSSPASRPQTTPKPAAPTPARATDAGEGSGGFMVQVGSFASRDNAEHLAHKLRGQGFASASVSQYSTGRHLYRVRVGPVHDRTAAATLQGRLKAAGHAGAVVPK